MDTRPHIVDYDEFDCRAHISKYLYLYNCDAEPPSTFATGLMELWWTMIAKGMLFKQWLCIPQNVLCITQ